MKTPKESPEKINLRLPAPLKLALQDYAEQAGVSVNTACLLAIQNFLPFALRNLKTLRAAAKPPARTPTTPPAGRNEPCTCGSGKKYKHCHGNG